MFLFYILTVDFKLFQTSGNNRLGGQDFNQRLMSHLRKVIEQRFGKPLTDREDLQGLLLHVEDLKVNLTREHESEIILTLHSLSGGDKNKVFSEKVTRELFEDLNKDLFTKVLEPIQVVLKAVDLTIEDIDETILVGGSTRIPKIRQLIGDFFKKAPITSEDPDLAVATGVSIQAGILGGMWPLTVSAVELPTQVKKIHV